MHRSDHLSVVEMKETSNELALVKIVRYNFGASIHGHLSEEFEKLFSIVRKETNVNFREEIWMQIKIDERIGRL